MGLSDRTVKKLLTQSAEAGSKVYDDKEDPLEEDVTHFEEDDDPLTHAGDEEDDAPVGEVPDGQKGGAA